MSDGESLKMYSQRAVDLLHNALIQLEQEKQSQYSEGQRTAKTLAAAAAVQREVIFPNIGIEGKRHVYESDSDDDNDKDGSNEKAKNVKKNDSSDDDNSDESDISDDEIKNDAQTLGNSVKPGAGLTSSAQMNLQGNNQQNQSKKVTTRKKNIKKTREELMKQMGPPPQVSITINIQEESNTAIALTIPNVLLPSISDDGHNDDLSRFYKDKSQILEDKQYLEPLLSLYNLANNLSSSPTASSFSSTTLSSPEPRKQNILIILLQSGRFAAAIFSQGKCIKHTTSARYTTRKGQGGSQSSLDNTKGKAKSVGSQLRRAGETQLRNDVETTLKEWKEDIDNCSMYFLSISKMLQKGFWQDADTIFSSSSSSSSSSTSWQGLKKGSNVVRNIPLDVGRPSFESCWAVYELIMTCTLQKFDLTMLTESTITSTSIDAQHMSTSTLTSIKEEENKSTNKSNKNNVPPAAIREIINIPLNELHEAARDSNIDKLLSLLSLDDGHHDDIDSVAGPDLMTPLHYAALSSSSDNDTNAAAAKCVVALLTKGHANPCMLDSHDRPAYYLTKNDTVRNAFRKARFELGEEIWDWTDGAKVGPPLSNDDIKNKREKAAEKKRKQKARQKERKALEQKRLAEEELRVQQEQEKKEQEENSRRIRAGLKPKPSGCSETVCDFCLLDCEGKRKSQLFSRLDFLYCSSDCMRKHQRELMAAAATARFSGK
mmetsp:Transcript_33375/g.38847  ORF Transcript_33375/g.38847 Transcript_33375/m.38847 type:complete len:715 (+) Transcript_33375:62-2206(+)